MGDLEGIVKTNIPEKIDYFDEREVATSLVKELRKIKRYRPIENMDDVANGIFNQLKGSRRNVNINGPPGLGKSDLVGNKVVIPYIAGEISDEEFKLDYPKIANLAKKAKTIIQDSLKELTLIWFTHFNRTTKNVALHYYSFDEAQNDYSIMKSFQEEYADLLHTFPSKYPELLKKELSKKEFIDFLQSRIISAYKSIYNDLERDSGLSFLDKSESKIFFRANIGASAKRKNIFSEDKTKGKTTIPLSLEVRISNSEKVPLAQFRSYFNNYNSAFSMPGMKILYENATDGLSSMVISPKLKGKLGDLVSDSFRIRVYEDNDEDKEVNSATKSELFYQAMDKADDILTAVTKKESYELVYDALSLTEVIRPKIGGWVWRNFVKKFEKLHTKYHNAKGLKDKTLFNDQVNTYFNFGLEHIIYSREIYEEELTRVVSQIDKKADELKTKNKKNSKKGSSKELEMGISKEDIQSFTREITLDLSLSQFESYSPHDYLALKLFSRKGKPLTKTDAVQFKESVFLEFEDKLSPNPIQNIRNMGPLFFSPIMYADDEAHKIMEDYRKETTIRNMFLQLTEKQLATVRVTGGEYEYHLPALTFHLSNKKPYELEKAGSSGTIEKDQAYMSRFFIENLSGISPNTKESQLGVLKVINSKLVRNNKSLSPEAIRAIIAFQTMNPSSISADYRPLDKLASHLLSIDNETIKGEDVHDAAFAIRSSTDIIDDGQLQRMIGDNDAIYLSESPQQDWIGTSISLTHLGKDGVDLQPIKYQVKSVGKEITLKFNDMDEDSISNAIIGASYLPYEITDMLKLTFIKSEGKNRKQLDTLNIPMIEFYLSNSKGEKLNSDSLSGGDFLLSSYATIMSALTKTPLPMNVTTACNMEAGGDISSVPQVIERALLAKNLYHFQHKKNDLYERNYVIISHKDAYAVSRRLAYDEYDLINNQVVFLPVATLDQALYLWFNEDREQLATAQDFASNAKKFFEELQNNIGHKGPDTGINEGFNSENIKK